MFLHIKLLKIANKYKQLKIMDLKENRSLKKYKMLIYINIPYRKDNFIKIIGIIDDF